MNVLAFWCGFFFFFSFSRIIVKLVQMEKWNEKHVLVQHQIFSSNFRLLIGKQ